MEHRTTAPVRTYTIDALIAEGFSRDMIRDMIKAGVLPRANGRGPYAYYTDLHLRILREVRQAKDSRRTIYADVREWAHDTFPHAFPKEDS